jgi:hypothetical protein
MLGADARSNHRRQGSRACPLAVFARAFECLDGVTEFLQ